MATLTYPSDIYVPQSGSFSLASNTRTFTSPLSGTIQTLETPGARWMAEISYSSMTTTQSRALMSFLVQLRGEAGRFFYGDPFNRTPKGVATGVPLVKGASQTGTTLITDGWTINTTNILKAGDYIQLATNELKMVVADASSDGSGDATLTIEPPLRSSPADNSAIVTDSPKAIMRLAGDDQARWGYSRVIVNMGLKMVEAFT